MKRSFPVCAFVCLCVAQLFSQSARPRVVHPFVPFGKFQMPAPAPTFTMTYNGGPLIDAGPATAYVIFYGKLWTASERQMVDNFLQHLGGTSTFAIDAEYFDGNGTYVSPTLIHNPALDSVIVPSYSQGKNLSDAQIQSVVASEISQGKLPVDKNGVYVVMTDSSVTSSAQGGFCVSMCGYHLDSTAIINGVDLKYAFVGNAGQVCPRNCSASAVLGDTTSPNNDVGVDGAVSILWHELSEAITDPDPNTGWSDAAYGEIGDECAWQFGSLHTLPNGSHMNQHIGTRNYLLQMMPRLTGNKVGPDTWITQCVQHAQ
jgi:hypothetical protein